MTSSTRSPRLNRRAAIGSLAATAAAGVAIQYGLAAQEASPHAHDDDVIASPEASSQASPVAVGPDDLAFPEVDIATLPEVQPLPVESSVDGVLSTTLDMYVAEVDLGLGHLVTTYTYNGAVPGATWEVRPGDVMRIHLANNLPEIPEGQDPHDHLRPHAWTTTNIHTHGLHVSPEGNADNIFLEIAPGETFDYEIEIPDDHTGGIAWYHPHKHGAACQQVRAGLAGALVVRGEIDAVPEVAAAREQILVLQAVELDDDFRLPDPIPHPGPGQAFFPRSQYFYTVNGRVLPKITMYPGEVQRWRMLNAAEGKFMSVHLEGHDWNLLAWDGLTLAQTTPETDLMMSSGNRVDVLVKAGAPGVYRVVLTPGSSQHPDMPGMDHSDIVPQEDRNNELKIRPIFYLEVKGEGREMALPTALPAYDPPIHPIVTTRLVRYTVRRGLDGVEFLDFGIDGVAFNPDNPPYQMKLGTAEEWIVTNDSDSKYPEHAHAMHIHVNPIKVTRINGRTLDPPQWRETMAVSGRDGDWFSCEMNIDDFVGRFVMHCHVLSHEDLGMMQAIEVVE